MTNETNKMILLEQYKLYASSADDMTKRRTEMNKMYLAMILALFTVGTFLGSKEILDKFDAYTMLVLLSLIGIALSITWYVNIDSYKRLNKAKFNVIHKMEEELSFMCFKEEYILLKSQHTNKKKYKNLTKVEKYLPIFFGIIFFVILMISTCNQYS
ncbi:MAG: hypothetical protein CR967_01430 [Proteobacteria bacterium]|nr:MAG: hypothetical protein CR967_01430 [Pseudomonadota bacterium]